MSINTLKSLLLELEYIDSLGSFAPRQTSEPGSRTCIEEQTEVKDLQGKMLDNLLDGDAMNES